MNAELQQLRFKWNDHMNHVSKVLMMQRLEERFCDITLVSEDGFVMKAHQAILASTSSYFHRILADVTEDQHPMVVLRGANFKEISCLLDYMYQGITQVDQSLMDSVLEVADMLEIKGLSRIRNNSSVKKFMAPSQTATASSPMPMAERNFSSTTSSTSPMPTSVMQDHNTIRMSSHFESDDRERSHRGAIQEEEDDEDDDEDDTSDLQTSGIDLSMAKCEPWSPSKLSPAHRRREDMEVQEPSPAKKRRKLREGVVPEDSLIDPVSDPDWGKLNDKVEDKRLRNLKMVSVDGSHSDNVSSSLDFSNSSCCSKPATVTDKTLEVSCDDGPLTICLTTGHDLDGWQNLVKRKLMLGSSLPLRRLKRKSRARRELEEDKRRWLAKERKVLFGSVLSERPITRALEKLKNVSTAAAIESSEKVDVNCDPPFPTTDPASGAESKNASGRKLLSITTSTRTPSPPVSITTTKVDESHASSKPTAQSEDKTDDINVVKSPKSSLSTITPIATSTTTSSYVDSPAKAKFPLINPLSLFTLPPVKEREKQTRTTLTLEEKVKVIESFLDGKSQRQIANMYGIGKTQVSGIIKRREEILTVYRDSILRGEKLTMKRQRKSEYALLNEHLIQWYHHMTLVAGVKITTGMLRAKALQIAPELGYHDFKASNGWLATFKANNNLKLSRHKKSEGSDDQNKQHEDGHLANNDDDDTFFEEGETDESNNQIVPVKTHAGTSAIINVGGGESNGASNGGLGARGDPAHHPAGNSSSASSAVAAAAIVSSQGVSVTQHHPALNIAKVAQSTNPAALGANLSAAYNLTRDLSRDLGRTDPTVHLGDLHTGGVPPSMTPNPLNHSMSAAAAASLNVARGVDNTSLGKPADALAAYKSEEPLAYGYDHQVRMNDPTNRTSEYNYGPYGFPGSYYGYHFLGQY
ncbi:uncharacterized protein LOC143041137 [Oratosquilla oratoria]|uniref:uncharacterized protein LOC143041137 n=1 Tax=Oratosquilla oratoria TaxID=337810 RepID=UPI003F75AAB8